jgi:AraC family transcriptional regulator
MAVRTLARGPGWSVADVICTCGPRDRPYEEQHAGFAIGLVLAGAFTQSGTAGRALMTPGSMMLGRPGASFECGHQHGFGDRCVSFCYSSQYFEQLLAGIRSATATRSLNAPAIPPLRDTARLLARAGAGVVNSDAIAWNEFAVEVAATALAVSEGLPGASEHASRAAEARIGEAVRAIDRDPAAALTLDSLAAAARLSPFHFLRTFERSVGVTPHQYIRRARLRTAATRLLQGHTRIIDIALDSGFGDVSNFNRAFRAEFGASPRQFARTLLVCRRPGRHLRRLR